MRSRVHENAARIVRSICKNRFARNDCWDNGHRTIERMSRRWKLNGRTARLELGRKSFYWYRLAAEQGHASAQHHLGYCYDNLSTGYDKYIDLYSGWCRDDKKYNLHDVPCEHNVRISVRGTRRVATLDCKICRRFARARLKLEARKWVSLAAGRPCERHNRRDCRACRLCRCLPIDATSKCWCLNKYVVGT
eukprot:SAG31_NODE_10430_length_1139_cov_53.220192_1_plen_192_part_00